ncbi:hypothetical protein CK203_078707 [Vitis vinifera]|uniref:Uncharacterized protein n=1 Tax=Vitis vinifera TaxID=29760 RepID=A0A438E657_VITVI|nr:hypothetical protein CK203_078707 [Vitis vinifera]
MKQKKRREIRRSKGGGGEKGKWLKDKGGKSLEDVLREIERGRSSAATAGKVEGWKPSLESIMESPEVVEMER